MPFVHRYRVPALGCALAVLVCELIAHPYTNIGICDDGPYILLAKTLANTGHIAYNGWSAAMLLWQLYLGAAFIKLFGFSFTTVRMSTLLVAVVLAFFLQRVLVLVGSTERNATIGTLALVLSPLYLLLSVTFMSDIHGLFAIVLCLYGCLRALRSVTTSAALGWLTFAVVTNGICGTSRQLAWLGIVVMVPCTLWMLRARPRIVIPGIVITLTGVVFIFGCLAWMGHQPYTTPEKFAISLAHVPMRHITSRFAGFFLELPLLLLPIMACFLLELRRWKPRTVILVCASLIAFVFIAAWINKLHGSTGSYLEPSLRDPMGSNWVTVNGEYEGLNKGAPHLFLAVWMQILLSAVCLGGVTVLVLSLVRRPATPPVPSQPERISWRQLAILLGPFAGAYLLLLVLRAASVAPDNTGILFDRYALGLLVVALIFLVREFQERVHRRLPAAGFVFVLAVAVYGVAVTHNTFSLYRARETMRNQLHAGHIPDTAVDNGWEENILVELRYASYINNPSIVSPRNAYVPVPSPAPDACPMVYYQETPHITPAYGISFDSEACYGAAAFAPVSYSRWLASQPGKLYVVRYHPPPPR